ncbi:hypothetical protein AWZ03_012889 [Drosophila navojoa]|uniref:Secreted protein n=1 Tax=Drosophila navojoa TaxID=7232 RepID=A0A484AWC3_DRONA|nr:hypothetical protein AWZ03_012889 [Drosophila navojoa]
MRCRRPLVLNLIQNPTLVAAAVAVSGLSIRSLGSHEQLMMHINTEWEQSECSQNMRMGFCYLEGDGDGDGDDDGVGTTEAA